MSKRSRPADVEAFLDIEADEAEIDGDSEDGDEEMVDNFLDEEEDFPDLSALIQHRRVSPPPSVEFDAETSARRIKERSRRENYAKNDCAMPLHMWMIRTQAGQKDVDAKRVNARLPGSSVAFAVRTLPGRFYIQAASLAVVRGACSNLVGLEHAPVLSVPIDEHHQVLRLRNEGSTSSLPHYKVGEWVTVKKGIYKGDLGRVRAVSSENDSLTVAVMPRIRSKQERTSRPEAKPFDADAISVLCKGEKVTAISASVYRFRRRLYKNGLCELNVPSIHFVKKCCPSLCDVGHFAILKSSLGDLECGEPFLRVGDRVRITSGPQASLRGVVSNINGEHSIVVDLVDMAGTLKFSELQFPVMQLQRILRPGDHVRARVGRNVEGIIVSLDDESVSICDANTSTEVRMRAKWVETYEPDFRLAQEPVTSSSSDPLPHFHDFYKGHRIYVRGHKELKGAYGYVHSSHPTQKTAQITRDGSNDNYLHTIELKDLISVLAVACLDGAHPLTEQEREHYYHIFNSQSNVALTRSSTPLLPDDAERPSTRSRADIERSPEDRSSTPPQGRADHAGPSGHAQSIWSVGESDIACAQHAIGKSVPALDFSLPGMWIFHPKVQARLATYHIHFALYNSSRPIYTEPNSMDSADHLECFFSHSRCKLTLPLQNSSLAFRNDLVMVDWLRPRRPVKTQQALIIRGNPDVIGSIVVVKGFTKDKGVYVTAKVVDEQNNKWLPVPIDNLTRIEKY